MPQAVVVVLVKSATFGGRDDGTDDESFEVVDVCRRAELASCRAEGVNDK